VGYGISGSTFLALVYDRAPAHQQGRAVGLVWTFLIGGYPIAGILFSRLLPHYEQQAFVQLFVIASSLMFGLWFFALWGEEKPQHTSAISAAEPLSLSQMVAEMRRLWAVRSVRLLTYFIVLSFLAGFMQDALLEPFGGRVFDLSVGETTRFQAYWGTMAILSSLLTLWAYRRFAHLGYQRLAGWGVWALLITFAILTLAAWTTTEALLRPSLLLLGVGYGLWNIGTLGLMIENSRAAQAGLDLGIWTVITTLARGGAILVGTICFDLFQRVFGDYALAYGAVFAIEAVLLGGALLVLRQFEKVNSLYVSNSKDSEIIVVAAMD
jgi:BCD family chlorophyll transporter-like MFS transporter